jgi:RHS repeat-associated protein
MYDCSCSYPQARFVYKFAGKKRGTESNLDNSGARYNSSQMRRFMTPEEPLIDQDWNLYSYVRNNQVNNTDPSGNACVSKGRKDDDSRAQTCADANDPKSNNTPSAVVTAKAPPSAFDQRILVEWQTRAGGRWNLGWPCVRARSLRVGRQFWCELSC